MQPDFQKSCTEDDMLTQTFQVSLLDLSLFLRQWPMPFLPNYHQSTVSIPPSQELFCIGYLEPLKILLSV